MSILASQTDGNARCRYGYYFQTTVDWKVAADAEDIAFFREITEKRLAALRESSRITDKQLNLIGNVYLDKLDRVFLDATQNPESFGRGVWDTQREIDTLLTFLENTGPVVDPNG